MTKIRRLILAVTLIAGLVPAIGLAQVPGPVPALPDTERRTSYTASATTGPFSVNFALYGDSTDYVNWLEVYVNGVLLPQSGSWTLTSPSGPIATLPRPISDAQITFVAAQTGTVQIVGARRPRRISQYQENAGVSARNLNRDLTDIIAQNREIWDKTNDFTGRGMFAPPGETMRILPPAASRANQGVCFDASGSVTTCVSVASSTFAAGTGIAFSGTNPTSISVSLTNAICTLSPSSCLGLFGYANPVWYGAACDGATDDTVAFNTAVLAANRKVLSLPAGATCVVRYLDICSNPTCLTGHSGAGGSVPFLVQGNGATLLAHSAASGANTFVYVEQQTVTNLAGFAMRDLIINGNNLPNRGLTVVGCVYCTFDNISESNAQVIGCHFNAMVGFVNANNLYQRIQCNTNNTNSGTLGVGILENTSATWLGSSTCASFAQNAGNAFVSVHTLFNGSLGWDVECANNSHYSADSEQNLNYGISLSMVSASEWFGSQTSSNKNARGSAGTGGDASVINNDGSPGIQFFGGASDGTFTNVDAAHSNTVAMRGVTGFGYTANCNASGHYCMTLP